MEMMWGGADDTKYYAGEVTGFKSESGEHEAGGDLSPIYPLRAHYILFRTTPQPTKNPRTGSERLFPHSSSRKVTLRRPR